MLGSSVWACGARPCAWQPMQPRASTGRHTAAINAFKQHELGGMRLTVSGRQGVRNRLAVVHVAASTAAEPGTCSGSSVLVAVKVPDCPLQFGEHLRLVGSCAEMGGWDAKSAPSLDWQEGNNWVAELALPPGEHLFKLVIMRSDGEQQWEDGNNRELPVAVAAAPAGSPALRATCHFGDTTDMNLAELAPKAAMAEASATLPTPEPLPSVVGGTPMASSSSPDSALEAPVQPDGTSRKPTAVNGDGPGAPHPLPSLKDVSPMGPDAKDEASGVDGKRWATQQQEIIVEDDVKRQQQAAKELAESQRQSQAATTSKAMTDGRSQAWGQTTSKSGLLPVLLPLCAGGLFVGIAALNAVPGLELPSVMAGGSVGLNELSITTAGALTALQKSATELSSSVDLSGLSSSAADALTRLQTSAAELSSSVDVSGLSSSAAGALTRLQTSAAELSSSVDVSGLSSSAAGTLSALQTSAAELSSSVDVSGLSSGAAGALTRLQTSAAELSSSMDVSSLSSGAAGALAALQKSAAELSSSVDVSGLSDSAADALTRLQTSAAELSSSMDVSSLSSGAAGALAALQKSAAELSSSVDVSGLSDSAADALTRLQTSAAELSSSVDVSDVRSSAAGIVANLQKSAIELSSSVDVSSLQQSGKGLLTAFEASSNDVLANLKANSAALQESLAHGLSSLLK
ncbi:hypothetical protein CHLNCDRAFT_54374 [Chlorella variabilis]|uniref:CBM20 domain-containing protein n=1 Tax=Chlorella variabilis TaxID=554065 RepID=E1ZNN1_CHLVA|nr:hypothetical protein CHLNCDRAFT_54374 [Chlorella variabilis]EFN52713.1 hypothetical protein CHLNCDRAFT_54374 [Chlorella variabilis]|eukprot:XP_005844815.1 hypothetical protein CHLNCDRAFT_54374 [Chlorella variabilis]